MAGANLGKGGVMTKPTNVIASQARRTRGSQLSSGRRHGGLNNRIRVFEQAHGKNVGPPCRLSAALVQGTPGGTRGRGGPGVWSGTSCCWFAIVDDRTFQMPAASNVVDMHPNYHGAS